MRLALRDEHAWKLPRRVLAGRVDDGRFVPFPLIFATRGIRAGDELLCVYAASGPDDPGACGVHRLREADQRPEWSRFG